MEGTHDPIRPEAATDEPASSPIHPADGPSGPPEFATDAEDAAFWQGVTFGIRAGAPVLPEGAGQTADAPFESRRVRRARHDGFDGPRQAVFLEALAEGATVAAAARAAGICPNTAYNLRNRREGRAFDLAWEAAIRRSRKVLADRFRDRVIDGQVSARRDKDGNVIGTRHFVDNRLAMAVLTRMDRHVEAYRDETRLIGAVAEQFEEVLDCIEAGGDAEALIEAMRPESVEHDPIGPPRLSEKEIARRLDRMYRFADVDPDTIDTSDLDPAKMDDWTEDQWDRAEASGFLDRLPDADAEGAEAGAPR